MATVEEARYIIFAPKDVHVHADEQLVAFVKERFMGKTFAKGDIANLPIFGSTMPFVVVDTTPSGQVKVTDKTVVAVWNEPVEE